jgi:L-alanine-DL-glutamate epimerase-like enolase superfamily enzyme
VQAVQETALGSGSGKTVIAVSPLYYRAVTSTGQSGDRYKTGVNIAASLHFVASLPNTHYFEYCVEKGPLRQTLTRQRFPVIDGNIAVPEAPGLGIDLDEDVVARYRVG